jgi:galactokinase
MNCLDTCSIPSLPRAAGGAIEAPVPLDELVRQAEEGFRCRFGRSPRWLVVAPGRVNLIGEHTDYNEGFVLPMAIERYVVMAADVPAAGGGEPLVELFSSALNQREGLSLEHSCKGDLAPWARYVFGVMRGCWQRGLRFGPLDVLIEANVPLGGGLSSSAALEVAMATLLESVSGRKLAAVEKALLCQQAEHEYAGVPCGIMDQFTSVMGQADHLMLLDCRSTEITMVPLSDPEIQVLIINTNVKHELAGGEYAQRRSQCELAAERLGVASLRDATLDMLDDRGDALEPVLRQRARHVIGEIGRTRRAAEKITAGLWSEVGRLMYQSHASLRDDYQVSCLELDLLVELACRLGTSRDGMIGSRMTGGGFGGCTVALVRQAELETIAQEIRDGYQLQTGIVPTLFTTRPAKGAQVVRG